jgi:hypothetical protein
MEHEQIKIEQLRATEKTIGSLLMEVEALHIPAFQRCYKPSHKYLNKIMAAAK